MNRQKPVFYSNKYERKNVVQFSIKMPVKRQQPLSKKLLQGQSSAHTSKRKQIPQQRHMDQSTNISGEHHRLQKFNHQQNVLNQDQIRNSAIYKLLQQQINELTKRQGEEIKRLKKIKQQRKSQIESIDKQSHGIKLQIWQLRNQALQLKQSIQQQKNETERLMQELGDGRNQNQQNEVNEDDDDL